MQKFSTKSNDKLNSVCVQDGTARNPMFLIQCAASAGETLAGKLIRSLRY